MDRCKKFHNMSMDEPWTVWKCRACAKALAQRMPFGCAQHLSAAKFELEETHKPRTNNLYLSNNELNQMIIHISTRDIFDRVLFVIAPNCMRSTQLIGDKTSIWSTIQLNIFCWIIDSFSLDESLRVSFDRFLIEVFLPNLLSCNFRSIIN